MSAKVYVGMSLYHQHNTSEKEPRNRTAKRSMQKWWPLDLGFGIGIGHR